MQQDVREAFLLGGAIGDAGDAAVTFVSKPELEAIKSNNKEIM